MCRHRFQSPATTNATATVPPCPASVVSLSLSYPGHMKRMQAFCYGRWARAQVSFSLSLSRSLTPGTRQMQAFCYGRWAWAQGLCNDADMQTQFVVFHGLPFFGSLFFVWENTIRERRGTSAETGQRSVAHRTSAFEGRSRVPFSLQSFHSFWIQGGWERKICMNYTCGCVRSLGN